MMWMTSFLGRHGVDERFLLHRYKSTSNAGIAAAFLMGGWFLYDQIAHHVYHWDFAIILTVMVIVKYTFMIWYRKHD